MRADKGNAHGHGFGTFSGVFTPSILTIFGVIMYMRACYVTGSAGIIGAMTILFLAKSITFSTAFSISAISTNTEVRGGGAYFLISRALGPEFGAAIGIALFLAQTLSVPFYVLGFAEALLMNVPVLADYYLPILVLTAMALFAVSWFGADWAMKCQFFIMAVLGVSIFSFLTGAALKFNSACFMENLPPSDNADYFRIFAIYFPAVTGIMAGVNMSGDLKNPAKSLPLGTFMAIFVGLLVYGLEILFCGGAFPREMLISEPYMLLVRNAFLGGILVIAGVWAASLSSAIGSFLGAPRVLQALALDKIIPFLDVFSKGAGKHNEPRFASVLTFAISMAVLLWAGWKGTPESGEVSPALNIVATIVTMFFLYTYGMVNLAAFVESFGANPSFRPKFKYFHWSIGLFGAIACLLVSFLISPLAAICSIIIIALLFFFISRRDYEKTFGDARRGFIYSRIRKSLIDLAGVKEHPKNWRPTIAVFTGNPETRKALLQYACLFECRRGIVSMVELMTGDFTQLKEHRKSEMARLAKFADENGLNVFPEVIVAENFDDGLRVFIQAHSIGPIKPNIAMLGWPREEARFEPFIAHVGVIAALGMSSVVHVDLKNRQAPTFPSGRLDVWWRGHKNGSLMLILAYLLSQNPLWVRVRIRVLRIIESPSGENEASEELRKLVEASRIDAETKIVVSNENFSDTMKKESSDAVAIFMGYKLQDKSAAMDLHRRWNAVLKDMPPVFFVNSSGDADLLS